MRINSSTYHAIRIMLHLADRKRVVPSAELSGSIAKSRRYLMQIGAKLRDGGLIGTAIGMNGGYVLLREPALISVYDIITLMEGAPGIPESAGRADGDTTLHTALSLMNGYLEAYLRALTLDKLADKNSRKWRNEIADKVERHIDSLLPKG